jgi:TAT (twin-arginine translocation) pathway signal sequence
MESNGLDRRSFMKTAAGSGVLAALNPADAQTPPQKMIGPR